MCRAWVSRVSFSSPLSASCPSSNSRIVSNIPKRGSASAPPRRRTKLRSMRFPSPSRTSTSPFGLTTASAASSVQPPTKTLRRRTSACSSAGSKSWLQAMVSRRVRCRSGASRAPVVRSGRLRSNRLSNAWGGRSRTRAAANSMASGSPSRRRQIAATAGPSASHRVKLGSAACARVTNKATDGIALKATRSCACC
jgi:hypothetical protein